jgi:hypothetical protein
MSSAIRRVSALAVIAMIAMTSRFVSAQPPPVEGQVLIVLASQAAGAIDPRLANVPALRRPPFDSYASMALLESPRISLVENRELEVPLPNGRRIRLLLQGTTPDGRYRVRVSINRPEEQDYLPAMQVVAAPGDPFFVAGQSFQNGTLVIGVRLGRRS